MVLAPFATCYSPIMSDNGKDKGPSEDTEKAIICNYKTYTGYKAISKDLGITVSAVHNVIKMFSKHGTVKNHLRHRGRENLTTKAFKGSTDTKKPTWSILVYLFQKVPYTAH